MKSRFFFFVLLILCSTLWGQRNWTLYTNTTHIRDLVFFDDHVVTATWGGIEFFDLKTNSWLKTMTSFDGLSGNNVKALTTFHDDELMIGVMNGGIDRLKNNHFGITLSQELGLSSLRMNDIFVNKNFIYVGTDDGLIVFEIDESFPFPMFDSIYDIDNFPFRTVNNMVLDDMDYLYIGTNIGFSRVHLDSLHLNSSWQHYQLNADESVNSLSFYNGILVLGTSQRLICINDMDDIGNEQKWKIIFSETSISKVVIEPPSLLFPSDFTIYAIFGAWEEMGNHYEPDELSRSLAIINETTGIMILHWGQEDDKAFYRPVSNILLHDDKIIVATWGWGIYYFDKKLNSDLKSPVNWHNFKPNSIHTNTITNTAAERDKIWVIDGIQRRTGASTAGTGVSFLNNSSGEWTHLSVHNSPLISNNIRAMTIDSMGRKWFGAWWTEPPGFGGSYNGLSVLDDSNPLNPVWHRITTGSHPIINPTIYSLNSVGDQVWAVSVNDNNSPGGVNVFDSDLNVYSTFLPGNITRYTTTHKINGYAYFGSENGMSYWASNDLPTTNGPFWRSVPTGTTGIASGEIHFIDSYVDANFTQVWIAAPTDVVWKEIRGSRIEWYKATSAHKRERYVNGSWSINPQAYFEGEERIFGADSSAIPTALVIDRFGRVWIGSSNKGITMYNIYEDRFQNFTTANSPLHSNNILSLRYQESTGLLLIGTPEGLMTVEIGRGTTPNPGLTNLVVFPNPFRPDMDDEVSIEGINVNDNSECRIFDVSGQLVTILYPDTQNGFKWKGTNSDGRKVSSGIYFFLIHTEIGESERGRIVLIR